MFKRFAIVTAGILALAAPSAKADVCVVSAALQSMHSSSFKSQYLVHAHELAVKLNPTVAKGVKIAYYTADGSDVDLLSVLKKAIGDGCKVIIGLYTSRECLLAGPFLQENKVIGLSPSCGHDGVEKFKENLRTGVPPLQKYAKSIADRLNQTDERAIVLFQPTEVYSRQTRDEIAKQLKRPVEFVEFGKQIDSSKLVASLAGAEPRTLVFTTYPTPSYQIIEDLSKAGRLDKKTTILAASSWLFDLSLIRKLKDTLAKTAGAYVPDTWRIEPAKATPFFRAYQKEYGAEPENLAAFSYDLTTLALACRNDIGAAFDLAKFRACLVTREFSGVTGAFSFTQDSAFAQREVFLEALTGRL